MEKMASRYVTHPEKFTKREESPFLLSFLLPLDFGYLSVLNKLTFLHYEFGNDIAVANFNNMFH